MQPPRPEAIVHKRTPYIPRDAVGEHPSPLVQGSERILQLDRHPLPTPTDFVRRLRVPGYLVMALLGIVTFAEISVAAWPFRLHDVGWRLAVAGAASGGAGTALLAIFLALVIAVISDDRGVVLLVSIICIVAALCCIVGGGVFALDALQMKGQVKPELVSRYDAALVWGLAKIILAGIVFIGVAISAFRTAIGMGRATAVSGKGASMLVSGRGAAAPAVSGTTGGGGPS